MFGAAFILPAFFAAVFASGEFDILASPASLDFKGNEKLISAYVGDVYAASLGRSVSGNSQWSGLHINDPFDLPKSAIAVVVEGVDHLKFNDKTKTYSLEGLDIEESLSNLPSTLDVADIDLTDGFDRVDQYSDMFGGSDIPSIPKKTSNLKPQLHSEDKLFLQQIALLDKFSNNLASEENLLPVVVIRLSLQSIKTAHGENSPAFHEAEQLLRGALEKLAETVKNGSNKVLVTVISVASNEIRRSKRQAATDKVTAESINVAAFYNEDYPVIFNIILWFMIILTFTLLAISYAIATMDPGRDSIIYRMTSTRMKKDN